MTEEERAALFRQQTANRYAWRIERARTLAGDPAAAVALRASFAPLLPQPEDVWDEIPPLEPGRPPWEGKVPADIDLPEYVKRGS